MKSAAKTTIVRTSTEALRRIAKNVKFLKTDEDLRAASDILRARWSFIRAKSTTQALESGLATPGKKVSFDIRAKKGMPARTVTGTVIKANIKTIKIREDGSNVTWRVSTTLLRPVKNLGKLSDIGELIETNGRRAAIDLHGKSVVLAFEKGGLKAARKAAELN